MDGRLKHKELGTGRQSLIDEMRDQLSHIEKEESSLCLFNKKER